MEARILVGSSKPYVTTTTTAPSSGPVTVSEEVKFIDVGVKLVVTPVIHKDGYITMKIRPEVSSAATSLKTGQNNLIPIVDTSEVETTVRVKDGVTIMIGGLIKEEKSRGDFKVPVLGDIPLVGSAFKSQSRGKEQSEIVIFLTPRIISGDVS
jgi:type II secretory pathway component GspD/PulD (secretin)